MFGQEIDYIMQAFADDKVSGDGTFTARCHNFLESELNVPKALLTTSCTHALEMTALLLSISEGDEIIVPSFTFASTINAFVLRGAKPVFIDIRPDTLNLDEELIESHITKRTKAIVPVHYAGVGCEMDFIMKLADTYGIPVVEDNAHGLLGKYRGQFLGTFGTFSTLSFHETKNFSCGEGGALLINDPMYILRAEIIREKGTNRSNFFRGQVDKYTWVDLGSSYLPSELLAAFLHCQFEHKDEIQNRRKKIWQIYMRELNDWAEQNNVRLPIIPEHVQQSYHMFYLLMPSLDARQSFLSYLRSRGILALHHYLPLHLSDMGRSFGGHESSCPVTESVSDRLVRLPFFSELAEEDQQFVISSINEYQMVSIA
jgi:dTDP-4-amino-4,6-dideoxygalactose transaminase